jgi:hypothetical protein
VVKKNMSVIEYLKNLLQGRGFLPSFLVIAGWSYSAILTGILLFHILLYCMRKLCKFLKE